MHTIYNYNRTIPAHKKDIFKSLKDDTLILNHFHLLNSIEYVSENKRSSGTIFKMFLKIRGKLYRFKSKIIAYDEPDNIKIETYTRYGIILSQLNLEGTAEGTTVCITSSMDSVNFMTKAILKIMQPILNIALNRSINNFLDQF